MIGRRMLVLFLLSMSVSPSLVAAEDDPRFGCGTETSASRGRVTVAGEAIAYTATAGTITVDDRAVGDGALVGDEAEADRCGGSGTVRADQVPRASMSYVSYEADGTDRTTRPVTFVYNGGPGSASLWLHLGAFGPRRVAVAGTTHGDGAPYRLVENNDSLLDATDLVFVDAPGTGFGRFSTPQAARAFWGVDEDARAFANFIVAFLDKRGRWNSPKFLLGESYGVIRTAVLADMLEHKVGMDLNGLILVSQPLNAALGILDADANPGVDMPYALALPSYAATAWYHHRLPDGDADLSTLLPKVEAFAMGDYLVALARGADLDPDTRNRIADRLRAFTGLPVDYILRANLRVDSGEFEHELRIDDGVTIGDLDGRFVGPATDPLGKDADYDPLEATIGSAYRSLYNDYVRRTLGYGAGQVFRASAGDAGPAWNWKHRAPGPAPAPYGSFFNAMPDLASAITFDPKLRVQLNGGLFDLATPFAAARYEMKHLPIAAGLQKNIEYRSYPSGHMIYVDEASLKTLHDNVSAFIRRDENATPTQTGPHP